MRPRMTRKWRPPLALVIGGTLAVVLLLPLIAIVPLRTFGNIMGWREIAFLVGWMAVLSTAILGYLLWRLVLRPVYRLTEHADAVKQGRDEPYPLRQLGTPEFTDLAESVIAMGATLQNRADGLRAYTDHVTHELKSPLTTISGAVELMEGDLPAADRARLLETTKEAAHRMEHLLNDLRDHARARDTDSKGRVRLSEILPVLEEEHPGSFVRLEGDGDIPISETAALAVLTQLIQNAEGHGATEVRLAFYKGALTVSDNGKGVAEGDAGRIFDPFFTTKRAVGGTGMGLNITRSLLQSAGAEIELIPSDTGAAFLITF